MLPVWRIGRSSSSKRCRVSASRRGKSRCSYAQSRRLFGSYELGLSKGSTPSPKQRASRQQCNEQISRCMKRRPDV